MKPPTVNNKVDTALVANTASAAIAADYRTLIADAIERPAPAIALPAHLVDDGSSTLARVLEPFGLVSPLGPLLP